MTASGTTTRTYEQTHPWITFDVKWDRSSRGLWFLLGEAKSKCEHVGRALLKPSTGRELLRVFLVKGALATTAIEGNTLTEDQVRQILDRTLKLPPSKEYLAREVENVLEAYNHIKDGLLDGEHPARFTPDMIMDYNRLILKDLQLDEGVVPGEIRTYSVGVGLYRAAPPEDCLYLLERLCDWLNSPVFEAPPDNPDLRAPYAILKATLGHLYLAWIHPFGDGNGRTARLLELHTLLAAGFPAPTTQLLSNHYNLTRTEYYRQLHDSSRTSDPFPFILYAVRGFVDELRGQLATIWQMQFDDRWEQHVYQTFGKVKGDAQTQNRRLRLILALTKAKRPVPKIELRHLSPELAEAYAGKTERTLSRDVNALLGLELMELTHEGFVPNSDVMLAFQPEQAEDGIAALEPVLAPVA
jgi:Fic family protein